MDETGRPHGVRVQPMRSPPTRRTQLTGSSVRADPSFEVRAFAEEVIEAEITAEHVFCLRVLFEPSVIAASLSSVTAWGRTFEAS